MRSKGKWKLFFLCTYSWQEILLEKFILFGKIFCKKMFLDRKVKVEVVGKTFLIVEHPKIYDFFFVFFFILVHWTEPKWSQDLQSPPISIIELFRSHDFMIILDDHYICLDVCWTLSQNYIWSYIISYVKGTHFSENERLNPNRLFLSK